MEYKIKRLSKVLENGVEVKQLLTLEVTYADESTSEHGKHIDLGANPKEEAVTFAAELEKVLVEPKEVVLEEVVVLEKDKEVKKVDIDAKIAADEALKVDI